MSINTLMHVTLILPGDRPKYPPLPPPRPLRPPPAGWSLGLQGLIEATSNFGVAAGGDWARSGGAFMMPIAMGTARAAIPAAARASFFAKFRSPATRPVMIAWIRLFRLDPVT